MKKFLALLLALTLFTGVLTVLCGNIVFAEEANEATLWNPTEITLNSSKEYDNPYLDVDINAEFTHEDGTKIALPGFWKENQTWAVRFSPTKLGKWSYVITCTDATNTSLTATGELTAKENDGSTEIDKHGFVTIQKDARYYSYADGTPFFWLGDTNWQAPNYVQTTACNYPGCTCNNQFKHEVDDRASKGFNVYQTYFDSGETDGGGQRGKIPSIWTKKFVEPNADVFNGKIDYMLEYLHSKGMVAALGMGVHTSTTRNVHEDDLLRFARYVVARYACYSMVWISGQEITDTAPSKTEGKTCMEVYMAMASMIEEIDGYKHPNTGHMYPMMATDSRAVALDMSDWHDSWTLQQGHSRKVREKNFYKSYYFNTSGKVKPVMETEANYEDINCGGFTGYDASRLSAWNACLNGSAGFTYGVAGIWANCFSNEGNTGWFGPNSYSYEPWYMGLGKPGGYEVAYLKQFFETLPDWTKLVPRYQSIAHSNFGTDNKKSIATTDDNKTAVCYFYNDDTTTGNILNLENGNYNAYWFNPLTGKFIELGSVEITGKLYTIPEKPTIQDWAFVITQEQLKPYETEAYYVDVETDDKNTVTGKIITPAKVTAIGGVFLQNGRKFDQTALLYDLDGATAWEPLSDRVTQTIIYDLGTAYDLTHMTVVPANTTVLPGYRIEVSNNGSDWKIVANTVLRPARMSEDGKYVSEALTGAYRYVKLILLNSQDIQPDTAKKLDYALTYHDEDDVYYSHTAIAEISVFGTGIADKPSTDIGQVGTGEGTVKPGTNKGDATVDNGSDITTGGGLNKGVAIGIIAGGAVVGLAIGVVVAIVIKKKKD